MRQLIFMIVAAGLLATSALTSCKKEEVSEFYTELTETIDANGNTYYTGIKANTQ